MFSLFYLSSRFVDVIVTIMSSSLHWVYSNFFQCHACHPFRSLPRSPPVGLNRLPRYFLRDGTIKRSTGYLFTITICGHHHHYSPSVCHKQPVMHFSERSISSSSTHGTTAKQCVETLPGFDPTLQHVEDSPGTQCHCGADVEGTAH